MIKSELIVIQQIRRNGLSRVAVQRLIEEEKILVNGKKTKPSYKIQENDKITVEEEQPKEKLRKPEELVSQKKTYSLSNGLARES